MLIQQKLKEEMPQHKKSSINRINRMAERFARFVNQSTAANFKSRVLRPSVPVFTWQSHGFCQIPRRPGTGRRRELSSVGSGLTWSGQSNRCSA